MARADGGPGGIQDDRAHGGGHGGRPSRSGTRNPGLNVLVAGAHGSSVAGR
jgi:hypothetical protein